MIEGLCVCSSQEKNQSLQNHPAVIWEQELYDGFELKMDTPFFFTFTADVSNLNASRSVFIYTNDAKTEPHDFRNTLLAYRLPTKMTLKFCIRS